MIFASNFIESAFSPLIKIFEGLLVFLHGFLGNWGLAIVAMTMVIRAVMIPLTYRQLKSMQAMQQLAPELQVLKEKYKEDKQRQQQEIMGLYKERGVNPFSSCLPLLLQLPVFFSLFYMLRTRLKEQICGTPMVNSYEKALGHAVKGFSAIPEHTAKITSSSAQYVNGITVSASHSVKGLSEVGCNIVAPGSAKFLFLPDITERAFGISLIVLIVLYVGSQVASTLVATATADPTQRRIMLALPIIFVIILYRYPSGLLLYWITTNLWTIGQQPVIRRKMPPPAETGRRVRTGPRPRNHRSRDDRRRHGERQASPKPVRPAAAPSRPAGAARKRRNDPGDADDRRGANRRRLLTELLEEIADALDLDGEIIVERTDEGLVGRVEGEDLGLLIGRHGQTIDAVQHLAQRIVFPDGTTGSERVIVDAGGYRERRAEELRADADEAATEVLETGEPVELESMSPQSAGWCTNTCATGRT